MRGAGCPPERVRRARRDILIAALLAILLVSTGCIASRSSPSQAWSGVAIDGDVAYVGTQSGEVLRVNLERNGLVERVFSVPSGGRTDAFPGFYATPALVDGVVYAGGFRGFVFALDAETLTQRHPPFEIRGAALSKSIVGGVVAEGGRLVFGAAEGAAEGRLYVLDMELREQCTYPQRGAAATGAIWSTPTVVDGVAYFGDLAHHLHAVDIFTCESVWPGGAANLAGGVVAPPLYHEGRLYVGAFSEAFYEVDAATGAVRELLLADNWFWAKAATDGERVYAPSIDGRLYAIDIASRRHVWTYPADGEEIGPILSEPATADGLVVVGSDDENLVAIDAAGGFRVWDQRVGDKIRAPLAVDGSTVYVHALDRRLRAYDLDSRTLLWERDLEEGR